MSEKIGIDITQLNLFDNPDAVHSKKDSTEEIEMVFTATYYYRNKLIDSVAEKIHGEKDIEIIKSHLEFLYAKANENTLIDDIQERIDFLEWKNSMENDDFDDQESDLD